MPDITPDSPVSLLWPDGAGGLTGKRAQKRLASAGIATVGQLRDMDADDLLAIPRSAKGVLAETRRALTANGLHLALDPAPSPAQQREAREAGQAAAQRAGRRERARREDDPPVTAEDFAALAADLRRELAEADGETRRLMLAPQRRVQPTSFQGRPWAWTPVGPAGAAKVTGYTASSIRAYKARAAQARAENTDTPRTMPAPDPKDGKWVIGDLAMWVATRNEEQAAGYAAGPQGKREERRGTSLIPQTRKAAEAIAERDGQVTFLGLARELGVDYRTAVGRAAMAGIESDLAQEHAGDADVSAFLKARAGENQAQPHVRGAHRSAARGGDTGTEDAGAPAAARPARGGAEAGLPADRRCTGAGRVDVPARVAVRLAGGRGLGSQPRRDHQRRQAGGHPGRGAQSRPDVD